MKTYYVYILASKRNGTLYIGVTNNLQRRLEQHKAKDASGFTTKYDIKRLVYFEQTNSVEAAISSEKQLKHWNIDWKKELIEKENSEWRDLCDDL